MTANDLIAAFDTIADAPDGVRRLRELVIQLAVRGKLVEQREGEGVAITPRRTTHKADAKTVLPPFELPPSWIWCRLEEIGAYNGRPSASPDEIPGDAWLLDLEDIEKATSRLLRKATAAERASRSNKSSFKAGDVLYGKLRPYLDKVLVADADGYCTTEIVPVVPADGVASEWLRLSMKRPDFLAHVNELSYGVKMPRLGTGDAKNTLHPLPPRAEQLRIVARVDELMDLVDRLESARTMRHDVREAARDAALAALSDAEDIDAVEAAWDRIALEMDALFSSPEDVGSLRDVVLTLAVAGRLMPQDSHDEPAESLVARSTAEMHRRNAAGITRIGEDPGGYDRAASLPSGWCWCSLQQLVQFIDYRGNTPQKVSSGVRLVTAKNVRRGFINREPEEFVTEKTYLEWMTRGFPQKGDVLFTTEAPMGNAAVVDIDGPFALAQRIINLQPYAGVSGAFLVSLFLSPWFRSELANRATGMTATGIKAAKLRQIRVPVPPLAEQLRIVSKIDAIMGMCDNLEARLITARHLHAQFAAAAVHHLDV